MNRLFKLAALLAFIPWLASCVAPGRELLTNYGQLGPDQVVIVGKVVLTPSLDPKEQKLDAVGAEGLAGKMVLVTDTQWRDFEGNIQASDFKGRIEAPLGRTFFARSETQPFYVVGAAIVTQIVNASEMGSMDFPAGFKIEVPPGARAVYIGTIHYWRDEFNRVTKVAVEDEYVEADNLFKTRFGGNGDLAKALVVVKDAKN